MKKDIYFNDIYSVLKFNDLTFSYAHGEESLFKVLRGNEVIFLKHASELEKFFNKKIYIENNLLFLLIGIVMWIDSNQMDIRVSQKVSYDLMNNNFISDEFIYRELAHNIIEKMSFEDLNKIMNFKKIDPREKQKDFINLTEDELEAINEIIDKYKSSITSVKKSLCHKECGNTQPSGGFDNICLSCGSSIK